MDDYLMRYGFTPSELGLDSYLSSSHTGARTVGAVPTATSGKMDFDNTKLQNLPLTMAFVPMQTFTERYAEDKALKAGTLFPALDKPFLGKRI